MIITGPAETVEAILDAERQVVMGWGTQEWIQVDPHRPAFIQDGLVWAVTVQAFRNPGEPLADAARRLSLYLALHQEVHGRPPRLTAVQVEAFNRKEGASRG